MNKTTPQLAWDVILVEQNLAANMEESIKAIALVMPLRITQDDIRKAIIESETNKQAVLYQTHREFAEFLEEQFLNNSPSIIVKIEKNQDN